MEAILSSETSVVTRTTWRNIQENGILHCHPSENLKSYIAVCLSVCLSVCLLDLLSFDPEDISEVLCRENVKFNLLQIAFYLFSEIRRSGSVCYYYFVVDHLPTFGPAFINLYGAANGSSPCKLLCRKKAKVLEMEYGEEYKGRLLISIDTETESSDNWKTLSHIRDPKSRVLHQAIPAVVEVSDTVRHAVYYPPM
jgi:hypothetical protein